MRVETLEAYNVPTDLLEIWRTTVGPTLLPVQALAVKEYGLFTGGNLIVFSPTSSGKTFIGEMAAVKAARENTKVFYLVPQKALAEEKYREFSRRYAKAGIDVAISSRDRREFDRQILGRQFQIAIVVYEKLQTLLVSQPNLAQGVGLVVVDELQMLTDEERGPGLELLLTKLKMAESHPRLIGLSAVLGKASLLAEWLEAKLLIDTCRPVELRKGVLCQGVFRYREHNSEREGTEEIQVPPTKDRGELLISAADALTRRGEQVMVFVPDRATATTLAQRLATRARLATAGTARIRLGDGDDTLARGELLTTLENGVGFHHADLTLDEREIVEDGFRSGEIRAVVATTTLAIGMNLPAKNVLLDGRRWKLLRQYRRWSLEDLSKSEYENMSGRAGRLSLTTDFGRSILVTASSFEADAWMRCYIGREFEAVAPTLKHAPLEDHVLDVIASGMGCSRGQIAELLLASFTGRVHWKDAMGREGFLGAIDEALKLCREGGLVQDVDDGGLALTRLGRACAAKGLGVRTSAKMAGWAADAREAAVAPIEIITLLGLTVAGGAVYVALTRQEDRRTNYRAEILERARGLGVAGRPLFRGFAEDRWAAEYEEAKAHKKTSILLDWIAEVPVKQIEERYEVWAGAVARIGEEYGWLAEALSDVCRASNWPTPEVDKIRTLAGRLAHGVEADALPLARLRARGAKRTLLRRLIVAGLSDPDALRAAGRDAIARVIKNGPAAASLWSAVDAVISTTSTPGTPRADRLADAERQAEAAVSAQLIVDLRTRLVTYRGHIIPTRPPHNLRPQSVLALAALASRPGEVVPMTDLAADMRRLGRLTKRLVTPEAKELRYQIIRPFRRALAGIVDDGDIDAIVRHVPGEGLQLDAACSAEVIVASGTGGRSEPANEVGGDPEPTRRSA